jgi:hypothetical protein
LMCSHRSRPMWPAPAETARLSEAFYEPTFAASTCAHRRRRAMTI